MTKGHQITHNNPKVTYKEVIKPDQSTINAVFDYLFDKFINQERHKKDKNEIN